MTSSQNQGFRQVIQGLHNIIKDGFTSFSNQFKAYERRQKIVAESQLARLISILCRISGKNVKNHQSMKQLQSLSDHLAKENSQLTDQIKLLEDQLKSHANNSKKKTNKVQFQESENCSKQLLRSKLPENKRMCTISQKQLQQDNALHERNCERKVSNVSHVESVIVHDENHNYLNGKIKNSNNFNLNDQQIIRSLQCSLRKAENFIIKNNQQFTVEIQMYNEKIWELQEKILTQQEQIMTLQSKLGETQFLLTKMRQQNIRLGSANRNVKHYLQQDEGEEQQVNTRDNSSNRNKSLKRSTNDQKGYLKHFLRNNVSRSIMGPTSISKRR